MCVETGQGSPKDFWRSLWGMKIPPRVRIFIWRACNGAFPTLEKLARRRIEIETQCPFCVEPVESLMHLLLYYPVADLGSIQHPMGGVKEGRERREGMDGKSGAADSGS
ncbi:putative ribonuclease H protein [Sesamum alatum]|uniref:Ribonuclease H protein n=1 Tax=Sesamum alatum TaxID=300844 RepID=A0AAE1YD51_9LAMI|nr:putative ribonuclease H protein [Sesamum alatum]